MVVILTSSVCVAHVSGWAHCPPNRRIAETTPPVVVVVEVQGDA